MNSRPLLTVPLQLLPPTEVPTPSTAGSAATISAARWARPIMD
jgi:hypothetical protein